MSRSLFASFLVAIALAGCATAALAQQNAVSPAFPRLTPGRTLWIGHSLIRFTGEPDARGNAPILADVPEALEALRQLGVRAHKLARSSEHPRRVIASNGWAMEGYWDTEQPEHEFRRSALAIVRAPGLARDALGIGGDFERQALRGEWTPIVGSASARWDTIVSITMASYLGREVYEPSTASMSAFYDYARTGVDARSSARGAANPDVRLVHYMGVPPTDRVRAELCPLASLYAGYERRFARSVTAPMPLAFVAAAEALVRARLARSEDAAMRSLRRSADDQVHYSPRGVYLAACVFYALFYGDPRGLGVPSRLRVPRREAAVLQAAAVSALERFDAYRRDPSTLGCR